MRLYVSMLLCAIALACFSTAGAQETDLLEQTLREHGYTIDDLGYQPKGYWNRFPYNPPHRLPSFDDLFAEPLKLYDFGRVMSNTVEIYLNPKFADTANTGLYQLTYNLGVDKKLPGFRSYSANLAEAKGDEPILDAIRHIHLLAGQDTEYRTFGSRYGVLDVNEDVREKLAQVPDTIRTIIGTLLENLADAIHWRNLAFRNCDTEDIQKVMAIRDLAQTQGDGQKYYPEMDDIASTIDWPSLHYAALKTVAASEQAERALYPLRKEFPTDLNIEFKTPYGTVSLLSETPDVSIRGGDLGTGYELHDFLLAVEFGRDNYWQGSAVATSGLNNPVSVLIDLDGKDLYGEWTYGTFPCAGVGLCGIGCLIDSDGDDEYNCGIYAQGVGLFGVGVLLDRKGDDKYTATESAQGAGYFGIGLCFDAEGDDSYYAYGDCQGYGGVGGGVGVLADFSGDDTYKAEPLSEIFNRGDYHSGHKINANNAQGAGMGRRGDGSDGHAWAGGLGALIDIHGNDQYESGNFTLGVGYWFGTGIVVDRYGDDLYKSCYFTQASGAHFCNGALIDEEGDDRHELFETAGAALGFGWDYTNALLIDKAGDDFYTAKMISYGTAQIRSNALFIEIGGDDTYEFVPGGKGFGEATFREDYKTPSRLTPYYSYAKSFGLFFDIGGKDKYIAIDTAGAESPHALAKDNASWLQPSEDDLNFGADNLGLGVDQLLGAFPWLRRWDK